MLEGERGSEGSMLTEERGRRRKRATERGKVTVRGEGERKRKRHIAREVGKEGSREMEEKVCVRAGWVCVCVGLWVGGQNRRGSADRSIL